MANTHTCTHAHTQLTAASTAVATEEAASAVAAAAVAEATTIAAAAEAAAAAAAGGTAFSEAHRWVDKQQHVCFISSNRSALANLHVFVEAHPTQQDFKRAPSQGSAQDFKRAPSQGATTSCDVGMETWQLEQQRRANGFELQSLRKYVEAHPSQKTATYVIA